jgi:DNA (cytosine-5)-methyltransferase 1
MSNDSLMSTLPIKKIKFIDLFAGIGGFHLALKELGGECVFVSENDKEAVKVYENNFDIEVNGDIKKINAKDIPEFDLLCAGFPCQPFSKGGFQKGFEDTRGTLFFDICRIIDYHKPKFILLENVPNLVTHDNKRTYEIIIKNLKKLGYATPKSPILLSPDKFGYPVLRTRVYIPCIRKDLIQKDEIEYDFSKYFFNNRSDVYSLINFKKNNEEYNISEYESKVLDMWNEFYRGIDLKTIGFPIWSDEFKENYEYSELPKWKQIFIKKNRDLYLRNKNFIDKWLKKHDNLNWVRPTHRKFEWQAGADYDNIYQCIIQFRPSGVRVKRPDKFSTLVAMNHPQIVGKYKRRLTPDETKLLQTFPKNFKLHPQDGIALKQLGNAVNVEIVKIVINEMFLKNEESRTNK